VALSSLPWTWLLLAPGAEGDHAAWFGEDTRAADECRTRWSADFAAHGLERLRARDCWLRGRRAGDDDSAAARAS